MATYIIGDLHGCFVELQQLLAKAEFNPNLDELWFTGDLIARGEDSLACLRFVKNLGERAKTVLGNHDLHFLAISQGLKKIHPKDKLEALLNAPDRDELIHWLRHQPLLLEHPTYKFVLTHAGISPEWDLATAKKCAAEVATALRSDDYPTLLAQMYDNSPNYWSEDWQGIDRLRYSVNVFTRMRFCFLNKQLDFDCKLPPQNAPGQLKPWFELDNPLFAKQNLLFGHWASLLGYPTPENIYALDTGCVWGNHLSMLRWEDKKIFTQASLSRTSMS